MKATVNLLGTRLEIEEPKEMDTLHKAAVLGNPRRKCICGNTETFGLDSNKDKDGNTYVNVVCVKCFAKSKLGQYKAGGYFWHEFEKYVKNGQVASKGVVADESVEIEDLPF